MSHPYVAGLKDVCGMLVRVQAQHAILGKPCDVVVERTFRYRLGKACTMRVNEAADGGAAQTAGVILRCLW